MANDSGFRLAVSQDKWRVSLVGLRFLGTSKLTGYHSLGGCACQEPSSDVNTLLEFR